MTGTTASGDLSVSGFTTPVWREGDDTEDNLIRAGYVGFNNSQLMYHIQALSKVSTATCSWLGQRAAFIVVNPFKNDAGKYKKVLQ